MDVVLLVIGFALLIYGAERFVKFAVGISSRLRVPSMLIGLTVVAFGTSMPEFAVSFIAALEGANDIAVANVVGSNIFNLALILGLCAIVSPIFVSNDCAKRDLPISLVGVALLFLFGITQTRLNIYSAGFLFLCFIVITTIQIRDSLKKTNLDVDEFVDNNESSLLSLIFGVMLSIGVIVLGGWLVVDSAVSIAHYFGVSERIIGLTIASIGTSLPELVTSVIATIKRQNDIAVGNVVGSNIFNIFFILGVGGVISPITISPECVQDCACLITLTCLFFIPAFGGRVKRMWGVFFVVSYITYILLSF